MLSVTQTAEQLGISPARVRALIKSEILPAFKLGREWMIREEDVLARMTSKPKPGRPKEQRLSFSDRASSDIHASKEVRELYDGCRKAFARCPSIEMIRQARTQEEASFYMAVADFFLQSKQRDLISKGVF